MMESNSKSFNEIPSWLPKEGWITVFKTNAADIYLDVDMMSHHTTSAKKKGKEEGE